MQKILAAVFLGFILQASLTTQACPDGTLTSTGGPDMTNHGTCTSCSPACKTCAVSFSACVTYASMIKGVDSTPSMICASATTYGSTVGYNSNTDTCDPCLKGCAQCIVDYNFCYDC